MASESTDRNKNIREIENPLSYGGSCRPPLALRAHCIGWEPADAKVRCLGLGAVGMCERVSDILFLSVRSFSPSYISM